MINTIKGIALLLVLIALPFTGSSQLLDGSATLRNDTLTLETSKVKRTYLWNNGALKSLRLYNKVLRQAVGSGAATPIADLILPNVTAGAVKGSLKTSVVAASRNFYQHLQAEVLFNVEGLQVKRIFRLYPGSPAIVCDYYVKGKPGDWKDFSALSESFKNIEDEKSKAASEGKILIVDKVNLTGNHWNISSIEFFDDTDYNNTLVQEYKRLIYRQENRLRGNLLLAHNALDQSRFFILKEAPASSVQLYYPGFDFSSKYGEVKVAGLGVAPSDLSEEHWTKGYSIVIGINESEGETGLLKSLRTYHNTQQIYSEEKEAMIVSNTWGDRNKDSRINEAFILKELEAAGRLGITHFQIDDGWETGKSSNSAIPGSLVNIWRNPSYWEVDTVKFPGGFFRVMEEAKKKNIELTLWFNPSVDSSFKNWEKDANVLIRQYKKYGIHLWKIDGVETRDKTAEINFKKFLDKVVTDTDDHASFNLDVTAGRRLGFNYFNTYGNLFLENRYTDWTNYYPHYTLRNLWQLSRYIPSQRLQIEFLNKWRNTRRYPEGDLLTPSNYSFDYLFAITMFAQPLAWFEVTGLPPEAFSVSTLISKYKNVRSEIHQGQIFPIGEEPSGFHWTGFQSLSERSGYILIFRENNAYDKRAIKTLLPSGSKTKLTLVAGSGKDFSAAAGSEGELWFALPQPKSFALYKYTY